MLLLGFMARELVTVGMRRTGKVAISPTIHTSPSQASSLQAALCNRNRKNYLASVSVLIKVA